MSHHLTISSASQNWQISGVEHVGQKVVTCGWEAFCTERTTCGLIPFQLCYVSAASQLYATARKCKWNHSTYTKHSYGKHDNFSCPIYFRNVFNTLKLSMSPNILVQVQPYTITQLYSTPNVCQFTKYVKICLQQRFGTKLIFQSWRIEWFPCDFEVIHSQVGQKFWPQWRPLQVDFVSSLIAQLQILRLMSKWPQGSNRFQMGRIQWIILVKFAWKLLGYFYCVCL